MEAFICFLFVSDFVGQTSDAATGAASIIVNNAGKCFCWLPITYISAVEMVCAHLTNGACVLQAHSYWILHTHTHPCIQHHHVGAARVTVINGKHTHTHTHEHKMLQSSKPCCLSTGSNLHLSHVEQILSCGKYSQVIFLHSVKKSIKSNVLCF